MKKAFLLSIIVILGFSEKTFSQDKIKWYSFNEASELCKKKPKKVFIDVYTDWCGWCKEMDNKTFSNSVIISYMNKNFYAVKFNGEGGDTTIWNDKKYYNPVPGKRGSTHQMVYAMMQGQFGYPCFIIMNEKLEKITSVLGYRTPKQFEPILNFYGENAYKKEKWEDYNTSFKGQVE